MCIIFLPFPFILPLSWHSHRFLFYSGILSAYDVLNRSVRSTAMLSFYKTLLQASAWPIEPEPYSAFHILLCAAGIPLAVFLARRLARTGTHPCGVLFICERGFGCSWTAINRASYIFVAGQGRVQLVVFFSFQLCSVPMYLCLILPLFKQRPIAGRKNAFAPSCRILALLGGVMALAEPSGLMHYLLLTLHGFLWHFRTHVIVAVTAP